MTTRARQREADRATLALQIVLAKVGVTTLADSIILWDDSVPQAAKAHQVAAWLDDAVKLVMTRRTLAVQIARAYYRLVRALITGKTIADPTTPEPRFVTLQKLRSEWAKLSDPRLSPSDRTHIDSVAPLLGPQREAQGQQSASVGDNSEQIEVENLDGLAAQEAADAKRAESQARENIANLGPDYRDKLAKKVDTSRPADEVDKQRQKAHDKAGARQAASGAREAMNGGRSHLWVVGDSDKRALGWIRVSLTGTPCGWCAMLISRGPVYKSQQSAEYSDGDLFHDNCHCVAVQVFSQDEYKTSPQYALNREYQELWPKVTRGYSGDEALTVWRRYIRQQQKQQTPAQAAGAPTNAQEAA